MLGFHNDRKIVKRPEQEPKFNPGEKVDRNIVLLAIISSIIVLVLIGVVLGLYYSGLWAA